MMVVGGKRIMVSGAEKKMIASIFQEGWKRITGKGPSEIVVTVVPGFLNIRCDGLMTQLEKNLLACAEGEQIIVAMRKKLFDNSKDSLTCKLEEITGRKPAKIFDDYLPREDSQSVSIVFMK